MSSLDIGIIVLYFVAIIGVALYTGLKKETTEEYMVGSREVPWWAVLTSIVATELSAATFLGVPGAGFNENFGYLQFGVGSVLARFFIAYLFITVFYKFNSLTIYDYLGRRFGPSTQYMASIFFVLTRILASGVRLMIAATGLAIVLNMDVGVMILIFAVIAIFYTFIGGIKAVIWTDMVQAIVFIGGGILSLVFLVDKLPDGWNTLMEVGSANGKFQIFKWSPDGEGIGAYFQDANYVWLAIVNGFVMTFAALGVDQDLTQRMLTCKNVKEARKSVIISGFIGLPVTTLFLFVGVALFVFFQVNVDPNLPGHDKVFSYFISNVLPSGARGFLVAGLIAAAMSSLDSALAALSSSTVIDIYKPLVGEKSEEHYLFISKINVIIFGVILSTVAYILKDQKDFLWLCFKMGSITYGAMLGVFLVAVLTKRGNDKFNLIGMIASSLITTILLVMLEKGQLKMAWTLLVVIGTAITFIIASIGAMKDKRV